MAGRGGIVINLNPPFQTTSPNVNKDASMLLHIFTEIITNSLISGGEFSSAHIIYPLCPLLERAHKASNIISN